ncbi:2335_t:CDS:1, partial [Dentiscutata heterogama]
EDLFLASSVVSSPKNSSTPSQNKEDPIAEIIDLYLDSEVEVDNSDEVFLEDLIDEYLEALKFENPKLHHEDKNEVEKDNYESLEQNLKSIEKYSPTSIHTDENCPQHEIDLEKDENSVLECCSNSAKDSQLNEQSDLDSYRMEAKKVVENKDPDIQNYQHFALENLNKACDDWNKRVNEFKKLIQDNSKAIEDPQPVKSEEFLTPDNKKHSLVSCCQSKSSFKKEKLSKDEKLFKWYSNCRKERTLYQVKQLKIDENEALQLLPILDLCYQIFDLVEDSF